MASNYRNPPRFDESTGYDTWKNEIKIWELVTDLDKKKQALAITLTLTGKAKVAALSIKAEDLNKEDGMKTLFKVLDEVFLKERKDSAYEAYKNFDIFRKSTNMTMSEYIIEFDQRYQCSKKYDMTLPDAVLAFKVLDNAELNQQERQLALTACQDLKYSSMKSALKRIFGDSDNTSISNEAITIKQESAMYTAHRMPYRQSKHYNSKQLVKGSNPLNKYGQPTKCRICHSIFHWAKDCQHRTELETESVNMTDTADDIADECNIILFTNSSKSDLSQSEILTMESKNSAIIDTACSRTVCGVKWLERYIDEMNKCGVEFKISESTSCKPFRFGDGNVVNSFKKVVIPAKIGSVSCGIESEVINQDIPLLLSKASLKKAGTVIDLQNDKVMMFNEPIELQFTSTGHYCVNLLNVFMPGDRVYYKQTNSKEWKGPAVIIGQDGPVVFVRHGGKRIHVHKCCLKRLSEHSVPDKPADSDICNSNQMLSDVTDTNLSDTCSSYLSDDETSDLTVNSKTRTSEKRTGDMVTQKNVPQFEAVEPVRGVSGRLKLTSSDKIFNAKSDILEFGGAVIEWIQNRTQKSRQISCIK